MPVFRAEGTVQFPGLFSYLAFLSKLLKKGSQLLVTAAVISMYWHLATVLQVQQLALKLQKQLPKSLKYPCYGPDLQTQCSANWRDNWHWGVWELLRCPNPTSSDEKTNAPYSTVCCLSCLCRSWAEHKICYTQNRPHQHAVNQYLDHGKGQGTSEQV